MMKVGCGMVTGLLIGAGVLLAAGGYVVQAYRRDPVGTFDRFVPKDFGSRQLAGHVAYGGDARQQLDIYGPRGDGAGRPVIVFFYGGAWDSGARGDYAFVGRALAAQGFVVAVADYRLLPDAPFPVFLEDCAAAVSWMRRNAGAYGGDGERIVLVGHSAGAYNAAMLALDGRWLGDDRRALRGFVGLAGPYDFLPLDDPATIAAFGGWPDLPETQPVHFADAGAPPVLLLHGTADTRVRMRNSEQLAARLRAAGVPVELKRYDGVDHAGIIAAFALPLRFTAPSLADTLRFAGTVTADQPAASPSQ